jgi:WD40 repeat protein
VVTASPDGAVVVVAGDRGLYAWQTSTGQSPAWLKPDYLVKKALFTPDGKTLLTLKEDRQRGRDRQTRWVIEPLEVGTGRALGRVEITRDDLGYSQFSRDGRTLIGREQGGKVTAWDAATGQRLCQLLEVPGGPPAVSADGKLLAFFAVTGELCLYELPGGRLLHKLPLGPLGPGLPIGLVFAPDGRTLAACGRQSLLLWDVATGKLLRRVEDCRGHTAFSPDGKFLACGDWDTIRVFDAATLREVRRCEANGARVEVLGFSPDGKRLLAASATSLGIWDAASGKRVNADAGHQAAVVSLAFAPDGQTLASGSQEGGQAIIWDLKTRRPRHRLSDHSKAVASMAFSPDGQALATGDGYFGGSKGSNEAAVRLWDVRQGRLLRQFAAHLSSVCDVAFSPDGKSLATAGNDARASVWDVASGQRRFQVRGLDNQFQAIAFSPDGRMVLIMGSSGELSLWDSATGEKVRDLGPQGDVIRWPELAGFAGGGKAVLTAEGGRRGPVEFRVWDTQTGKLLHSAKGPPRTSNRAHGLVLSPDGTLVAVLTGLAIELWDPEAGRMLTSLRGHAAPVLAVAFSADGRTLASGSDDTTVLLWDVVEARLEAFWADMGRGDRPAGADPARTVAFLKERLAQAAAAEKRVRALLPDLDSDAFDLREKATAELKELGPQAASSLREALKKPVSAEARSRIQQVLDGLGRRAPGAVDEVDRLAQAVKHLEAIGKPEARQALRELSRGDTGLSVTRLAQEALERLERPDRPR